MAAPSAIAVYRAAQKQAIAAGSGRGLQPSSPPPPVPPVSISVEQADTQAGIWQGVVAVLTTSVITVATAEWIADPPMVAYGDIIDTAMEIEAQSPETVAAINAAGVAIMAGSS